MFFSRLFNLIQFSTIKKKLIQQLYHDTAFSPCLEEEGTI